MLKELNRVGLIGLAALICACGDDGEEAPAGEADAGAAEADMPVSSFEMECASDDACEGALRCRTRPDRSSCVSIEGPLILSATIEPSTVAQSETSMADELFTITIVGAGFGDPAPTGGSVFALIGEVERSGPMQNVQVNGETVTGEVPKTWFGGVEPGTYNVRVEIESAAFIAGAAGAATVTIEAN